MFRHIAAPAMVILALVVMTGYGFGFMTTRSEAPVIDSMKAVGETGPLDGMQFVAELGPEGKVKDVPDVFVFENGTFVSKECELRCDYPARAYYIDETENGTVFVSNTRCPYKDAEITWHGTVRDNRITGTATWTVRRWYWTMTNVFEFEGTLADKPAQITSEG